MAGKAKNGFPPFCEEEKTLVEELVGSRPVADICKAVNRLNQRQGRSIVRTESSVRNLLTRLKLSARCMDDNLNPVQIADLLGASKTTVQNWSRLYGLPIRKISTRVSAIKISDFRKWAKEHQDMLSGLNQDGLEWLLDDRELAKELSRKPRMLRGVAVRRLDTMQKYSSLTQLYQQTGIKLRASSIVAQLNESNRFTANGIPWEVLK